MQSSATEASSQTRPGPAGLLIRALRPGDAEELAALVNLPGFRFGTNQLPYRSPEYVRTRMDKAQPGETHLVATVDAKIVGSGSLHPRQGRQSHVANIGLGVHDDWTGQGIGAALMTALLGTAESWLGLRRIELTVYVDNSAAIALYRRFGFEVEGTHRAFALRNGTYTDAHTMARLSQNLK